MKQYLALFLFLWLSYSCSKDKETSDYKLREIRIEAHMDFQRYKHFKRLILSSPDAPYASSIVGFDFEWGFEYLLRVKETDGIYPRSDGTRFSYEFDEVLSKTRVSDSKTFELFIDPNRYYAGQNLSDSPHNATIRELNDSTYAYFDKVEIEVPPHLRADFRAIEAENSPKMGTFVYANAERIRLIGLSD